MKLSIAATAIPSAFDVECTDDSDDMFAPLCPGSLVELARYHEALRLAEEFGMTIETLTEETEAA